MEIQIRETEEKDLANIQRLWADGDVMKFVGYPEGYLVTMEYMKDWFIRICSNRPYTNHYSIFDGGTFCGETFYRIDREHGNSACLDIKLFKEARGKGIATKALSYAIEQAFLNGAKKVWVDPKPDNLKALALYKRLGFAEKEMPAYLVEIEGTNCIYMEKVKEVESIPGKK